MPSPVTRLRYGLMNSWLLASCGLGALRSLVQWKDPALNRWTSVLFARGALKILDLNVILENAEELEKHQPCVYVGNHQSTIDVASYGLNLPRNTLGIGKKELIWVPFFGFFFYSAGNILIDRKNRVSAVEKLHSAVEALRSGRSIFIFPEGTRNRTDEPMLPFKKGAFHMAIEAQVPIVPLVSGKVDKSLQSHSLRMRVLPPISTQGLTRADVEPLCDRVRKLMLETYYELSRPI